MIGRLFDIKGLNLPYDMEKCVIQVMATSDELLSKPEDIHPDDMLKPKRGRSKPKTAILFGDPGVGKSFIVKYYAFKWSQLENGECEWDLIVILDMSTLTVDEELSHKDQIREAISTSLAGIHRDKIMSSLDTLNILIVPDGIDECRNKTVLEMLKELVRACYKGELDYTVLVTCRTGLSPIDKTLFDRSMKTEGFSIQQGLEYVEKFYNKIMTPKDESMLEFIANNTEDLKHVLPTPLCTHILSVVTADGTLELTRGKVLRQKALFESMEKSMKQRQKEKTTVTGDDKTHRFYNMSLFALLKDIKTFNKKMLNEFRISEKNVYLTFMTMKEEHGGSNIKKYRKFNHEVFHEYFASCALEALPPAILSAFLLLLSAREEFRNTQKLLFSALGNDLDKTKILSDMICATLLLQGKALGKSTLGAKHPDIQNIQKKAAVLRDQKYPLTFLLPGKQMVSEEVKEATSELWQDITSLFEEKASESRNGGLFWSIMDNQPLGLVEHLFECLYEVPEDVQSQLFADSIGRLLPSTGYDKRAGQHVSVYRTGDTRWSVITEYQGQTGLMASCESLRPSDMAEAFHQHMQHHHRSPTHPIHYDTLHLKIHANLNNPLDGDFGVWGAPPAADTGSEAWSDLLSTLSQCPMSAHQLHVTDSSHDNVSTSGFMNSLLLERTQQHAQDLLTEQDGGWRDIVVSRGIDFDSLHVWRSQYVKQNVFRVSLEDLECDASHASVIAEYRTLRASHGGKTLSDKAVWEIFAERPILNVLQRLWGSIYRLVITYITWVGPLIPQVLESMLPFNCLIALISFLVFFSTLLIVVILLSIIIIITSMIYELWLIGRCHVIGR